MSSLNRAGQILALSITTLVLLITACAPGTSTANDDSVWLSLLGMVPDREDTRAWTAIYDYAQAREIFDIPLPGSSANFDDWEEYITALREEKSGSRLYPGPFISGINEYGLIMDSQSSLAFDARNADQAVEAGLPPYVLEIVQGRFDPQATRKALDACVECLAIRFGQLSRPLVLQLAR